MQYVNSIHISHAYLWISSRYQLISRDMTKFEFEFDDVRILATSGVFDIRRIV